MKSLRYLLFVLLLLFTSCVTPSKPPEVRDLNPPALGAKDEYARPPAESKAVFRP